MLHGSFGEGEGSRLNVDGDSVVQCVALDDVLPAFNVNLIKMDIEGSEPAALAGARRMIECQRPGLAVCIYHTPDHLWSIATELDSWQLGYKFYLRAHAYSGYEVVLYGVPQL